GVFLAARRADIAGNDLAEMNADADAQRPGAASVVALHRLEHLARRLDRAARRIGVGQWRAEQRKKTVAEELVDDAVVAIDDLDQHGERAVEPMHHFGRRTLPR